MTKVKVLLGSDGSEHCLLLATKSLLAHNDVLIRAFCHTWNFAHISCKDVPLYPELDNVLM